MATPDVKSILLCILLVAGITVEAKRYCKTTGCIESEGCLGSECENGDCTEQGSCVCHNCWSGKSCDEYQNPHQPIFKPRTYETTLTTDVVKDLIVYKVTAVDEDAEETCHGSTPCLCAEIEYHLEGSNAGDAFGINRDSGEIFVNNPSAIAPGFFMLTILARDKIYGKEASSCILNIKVTEPPNSNSGRKDRLNGIDLQLHSPAEGDSAHMHSENKYKYNPFGSSLFDDQDKFSLDNEHSRHKRSVAAIPDNVTFTLEKVGVHENTTVMHIGDKIDFKLTIHFPQTTTDMLVELFSPDNDTTIMILCDVKIDTVGSNLAASVDKNTIKPLMEARVNGSDQHDRAIIPLGSVVNTGADSTNAASSMIIITWSVIMIENSETVNGSTYYVSAGAEYQNENYIWVGQASLECRTDLYNPTTQPKFNASGPSSVEIGSSGVFSIDMYLPFPSATITVDIFAPLNNSDFMSVCSVMFVGVGANYPCYDGTKYTHELSQKTGTSDTGNWRGTLTLGTVTNIGARLPGNKEADNRVSVQFAMHMVDNSANVGTSSQLGAAVSVSRIGANKIIWAATISVTATAKTNSPVIAQNPTFSLTTIGGNTFAINDVVLLNLDIVIPETTESDYDLEVLMPFNNSAPRMSLCSIMVTKVGSNVPCFSPLAPVYSSRIGGTVTDRGVYKLGRIKNGAMRTTAQEPDANLLRAQIAATVIEHPLNTNGAELWVTVGVKYSSSASPVAYVTSNKITIGDTSNAVSSNASTPKFEMKYASPSDHVYIGGSADVRLEVTTTPGNMYKPMDIEMILPYENDSLVMSVCSMEVVSVGKNLPCFDKTRMNLLVQYVAKPTGPKYYKAVLQPGVVCNVGTQGANASADDKFEIRLCLRVENHINLQTNGTKRWVSAGLMFHTTKLWVGQLGLISMTGPLPALSTAPHVELLRTDRTDASIEIGGHAIYHIYIKLPPYSTSAYRVAVDVSAKLHVCNLRVLEGGQNVPCIDKTLKANYTVHGGVLFNKEAILDLDVVSNIGGDALIALPTKDANTLVVAAIIQLPDTSTAVSSSHTMTTKVFYDSTSVTKSVNLNAIAATPPNTTASNKPSFSLSLGPDYANLTRTTYAKGETIRYFLDITVQQNSMIKMLVKFITPINITNAMEICDVNVIFVGENVPCVKKDALVATYESRSGSKYVDIGTLDLGYVCHAPIQAIPNVTDPDANTIRVEAIIRITKDNTLAVGDSLYASATVRNNNDQIFVAQLLVNVAADITEIVGDNETGVQFNIDYNITDPVVNMNIGKTYTIPLVVTLPPYSVVKLLVDASMPLNDTAVMTVKALRLVDAGANMACLLKDKDLLIAYLNSSQGTCQTDKGFLDFGIVTNTGIRYRSGVLDPVLDNTITIEMDVQVNDADSNVQNAAVKLSIGARAGSIIVLQDKGVVLIRDNNEKPELQLSASINDTLSSESLLVLDAVLFHTNTSSADAHNVTVYFYYPLLLEYDKLASTNHSVQPTVQVISGNYGVAFSWPRLMFCDVVAFSFHLKTSSSSTAPSGVLGSNATIPYEMECQMQYRASNAHVVGTYFVMPLDSVSAKVVGPKVSGCNSSLNVAGMNDCQFTSPASAHVGYEARQVKFNMAGFIVHGRRGSGHARYVQIYLGNRYKITELELKHLNKAGLERITSLKLQSSSDGYNWKDGPTVSPSASYTTEKLDLPAAVEGRYIRVVVLANSGSQFADTGFHVELYGCALSSDVAAGDICKWAPPWKKTPSSDFCLRSLLVDSSDTLFTCDVIDQNMGKMRCFSSSAGKWTGLDRTVINVIGYWQTENELYGLAWDKATYLSSPDQGQTWRTVPPSRWQKAKTEGAIVGKKIPWLSKQVIQPLTDPDVQYQMGSYGAGHPAIYKKISGTWTQIATWDW